MGKIKKRIVIAISGLVRALGIGMFCNTQNGYAGTIDNAQTFYNTYGSQIVFKDGYFYFATYGKQAASQVSTTHWKTIGYRMYVGTSNYAEYIYYSFTTTLVKSTLDGKIVGSVNNIIGHLGCIDFSDEDGRVYASLEYKNDAIGRGIQNKLGKAEVTTAFYVAIFDANKITTVGMDAEKSGVMRAVRLDTVLNDYTASVTVGGTVHAHKHGCSGIDGLAIGPDFGAGKSGKKFLHVCYGVYGDVTRSDNDYQVILQYDYLDWWNSIAKPLKQEDMHASGPERPGNKYFVYTGNTTYGVQNLEYDEFTGDYFACVYPGKKTNFPNYPTFVIDGGKKAEEQELAGCSGERGLVLSLRNTGESKDGIFGMNFPRGTTGIYSLGNGYFYVSHDGKQDGEHYTTVYPYKLHTDGLWEFKLVEDELPC